MSRKGITFRDDVYSYDPSHLSPFSFFLQDGRPRNDPIQSREKTDLEFRIDLTVLTIDTLGYRLMGIHFQPDGTMSLLSCANGKNREIPIYS